MKKTNGDVIPNRLLSPRWAWERRATDWKWLRPPQSQRESPPVTSLESSEDRALDETIENDVLDIAHLANVRADLRFKRRVHLVFFEAQIERLGQHAEKIVRRSTKGRSQRSSIQQSPGNVFRSNFLGNRNEVGLSQFLPSVSVNGRQRTCVIGNGQDALLVIHERRFVD